MSIFCLLAYADAVGKENITFEGLKMFKTLYWKE